MDRRNFLKLASAAGLSVVSPVVYGERGLKQPPKNSGAPYEGILWLFVNAAGGWDPTSLCDPKGAAFMDEPDRMNNYLTDEIMTEGNISYAPVAGNQAFFEAQGHRTMVVNGIDMLTNGHDAGNRHTWSGRLAEGHPSMAATLAASFGVEQPLAYLTFGGYSETAGQVARTRSGNINVLQRLAYPSRMNPDDETTSFHNERAQELIAKAQA
ncbi:MAG: twin-arginine translocation signal domain-containing protein, partial [Deltaproteobacteria bacterium]|nr:twin-arginine translocation signal domain-containing protein [Deltaproteobacteria bacterium]